MKSHYYHAIQSALKYYISCTYETRRGIFCSILSAQSSLSIFAQKYLCKCEDTYFILQNKYLCIHKDSFGVKILKDDFPLNIFFSNELLDSKRGWLDCGFLFFDHDFIAFIGIY